MSNTVLIDLKQGSSFSGLITYSDDSQVPVDLTGMTVRGQGRLSYKSPTPLFTFVFTFRDQTTNPGEVEWTLPSTALNALALDKEISTIFDVELVHLDSSVEELFRGVAKITPKVTK
jgi:hypothetical protein